MLRKDLCRASGALPFNLSLTHGDAVGYLVVAPPALGASGALGSGLMIARVDELKDSDPSTLPAI